MAISNQSAARIRLGFYLVDKAIMFDLSEIEINQDAMEYEICHPANGEVLEVKDGPSARSGQ